MLKKMNKPIILPKFPIPPMLNQGTKNPYQQLLESNPTAAATLFPNQFDLVANLSTAAELLSKSTALHSTNTSTSTTTPATSTPALDPTLASTLAAALAANASTATTATTATSVGTKGQSQNTKTVTGQSQNTSKNAGKSSSSSSSHSNGTGQTQSKKSISSALADSSTVSALQSLASHLVFPGLSTAAAAAAATSANGFLPTAPHPSASAATATTASGLTASQLQSLRKRAKGLYKKRVGPTRTTDRTTPMMEEEEEEIDIVSDDGFDDFR